MATKKPYFNRSDKGTFKIAAAASGPGVGGMKTWAAYRPVAKLTP